MVSIEVYPAELYPKGQMVDGKKGKEMWSKKCELESHFMLLLLLYPCIPLKHSKFYLMIMINDLSGTNILIT